MCSAHSSPVHQAPRSSNHIISNHTESAGGHHHLRVDGLLPLLRDDARHRALRPRQVAQGRRDPKEAAGGGCSSGVRHVTGRVYSLLHGARGMTADSRWRETLCLTAGWCANGPPLQAGSSCRIRRRCTSAPSRTPTTRRAPANTPARSPAQTPNYSNAHSNNQSNALSNAHSNVSP